MGRYLKPRPSLSQLVQALSSGHRLPGLSPKYASRVTASGGRCRRTSDIVGEWVASEQSKATESVDAPSRHE